MDAPPERTGWLSATQTQDGQIRTDSDWFEGRICGRRTEDTSDTCAGGHPSEARASPVVFWVFWTTCAELIGTRKCSFAFWSRRSHCSHSKSSRIGNRWKVENTEQPEIVCGR